jgi:hypothetical protein
MRLVPGTRARPRAGSSLRGRRSTRGLAQSRLEGLLPHQVIEDPRQVDKGLKAIRAGDALDLDDPVGGKRPPPNGTAVQADAVEPVQHAGQPPAGDGLLRHDLSHRVIECSDLLGSLGVHALSDSLPSSAPLRVCRTRSAPDPLYRPRGMGRYRCRKPVWGKRRGVSKI